MAHPPARGKRTGANTNIENEGAASHGITRHPNWVIWEAEADDTAHSMHQWSKNAKLGPNIVFEQV